MLRNFPCAEIYRPARPGISAQKIICPQIDLPASRINLKRRLHCVRGRFESIIASVFVVSYRAIRRASTATPIFYVKL